MARANEMEIVLTLDDKGFGASAQKIGDDVKSLAGRFMTLVDNGGKVQSMFSSMSRDLEAVAGRFGDVQKALAEVAEMLQKNVAGGMDAATKAATEKWKKMAELYGDLKIEEGFKVSVDSAAKFEIQKLAVNAMGFSDTDKTQIADSVKKLSDQVKFLNPADALKTLIAVRQSSDGTDANAVNATLATAVKAVNVMQTFGNSHGEMADEVTKLYGLAELRGQTKDPAAMRRTFDMVQRGVNATQGTVSSQDVDTVLRRQGELAESLSDEGLASVIGLIDQIKAMGDEAGSKGVSTMGSVLAMFQTYATGQGNTSAARKQFADAGVLGKKGLDLTKDTAGSFANVQDWTKDPVVAAREMVDKILAFTKRGDKNLAQFYHGKNPESDEAQRGAVAAYLQGMGVTRPAAQLIAATGVGDGAKHVASRAKMTESAKSIDQNDAALAKTYASEMQEVNAELEKLKVSVGTAILPTVKEFMAVLGSVVTHVREFAQDNPLATQLTAFAVLLPGIVLSLKGFMNMFGAIGTLGELVKQVAGGFAGLGGAAGEAGAVAASSGGAFAIFKDHLKNTWASIADGVTTHIPALNASVLGMAGAVSGGGSPLSRVALGISSIGTATKTMARIVGGTFLRMVPLLGELLIAWDFVQLLGGIQIGGARIDTWFKSWGDRLLTWALNLWSNIVSVFKTGSTKSAEAEIAKRNAELRAQLDASHTLLDSEKPKNGTAPAQPKTNDPKANQSGGGKAAPKPASASASAPNAAALMATGDSPKTVAPKTRRANSTAEAVTTNVNEAEAALKKLQERGAAIMLAANEATERFKRGGLNDQTDAFRSLSGELELTGKQLKAGTEDFKKWADAKNEALFNQARTDASNFATGYIEKNRTSAIALLPTERERTRAQLAVAAQAEDHEFAIRVATLDKMRGAKRDSIQESITDEETKNQRLNELEEAYQQERTNIVTTWEGRRAIRAQEQERALESGMAKMARDWKDAGKAVDAIGVNAGNNFVTMLINSLSTGHLAVGNFIKGILNEIATAKLKQTLADPLNAIITQGANWVGTNVFGLASGAAGSAGATERVVADNLVTSAATSNAASLASMTVAVMDATLALSDMAAGAGAGGMGGLGRLFGGLGAGSAGAFDGAASAEGLANFAGYAANGGVLTADGFVELRKYAKGGIARSPQVAIYGEAGPEAFVPLPDGRSIPVSMKGGGQASGNVQVNVINQTSTPVNAQQGAMRFDGKQMILDVVLSAATTPGAFRSGMKDAMKG